MALSDCVILTAVEPLDTSLAITVTLTAITLSQGGVTVPALQGTWSAPTDTRVLGVQFEYQESGANATRTAEQGVALTKWVATDGLVAGKTYAVRYRAVGLETFGDWTTPANKTMTSTLTASVVINQGDLAILDQVDTPEIVNEAATVQDVQIQTTGWGSAGPITIAYSITVGTSAYTQVDEYSFTYDGVGTVTIIWIGLIQWQSNSGRQANMLMSLNSQAPSYAGSPTNDDTQYQVRGLYFGALNNSTSTAVLGMTFVSGDLDVGTNTVKIWGRGNLSGANPPLLDVNAITQLLVSKK